MVIAGLLCVLGSYSLDDADLFAINRDEHRQDKNEALHDVLEIGIESDDVHPVREYGDDEGAEDCALDAPDASGQRRAAHDDGGDCVKFESLDELRRRSHSAGPLKQPDNATE